MNFAFIRKLAQRDLKSGEVALLLISLLVAVGTVTSISLFVDRLHQALLAESASFLAADRQISSSREIPQEFLLKAQAREVETSQTMVFSSMVFLIVLAFQFGPQGHPGANTKMKNIVFS